MEERNAAPVHDALCVNYMLDPSVVTTLFRHVDVECHGTLTVGRTVVDTHHRNLKDANCHVAFAADRGKVLRLPGDDTRAWAEEQVSLW